MEYGKTALFVMILLPAALILSACSDDRGYDTPEYKIGLVSTEGGFNDNGFNQLAYTGFLQAAESYSFSSHSLESQSPDDIRDNINALAEDGYDLIIALGFQAAEHVIDAANAYPDIEFALLDLKVQDPPSNMSTYVYRVDQSAFLCGYLAAYWADKNRPDNAMVGWIGGPPITEIERFRVGYSSGVTHFNETHDREVDIVGMYARGFLNPDEGAEIADFLIEQGASVIFPFAGITGHGALMKAKQREIWGIGVDHDQYFTLPEASDILITSNLKRLDSTVYELIGSFTNGTNWGNEPVHFGTLENGTVDLAPFHNFEGEFSDSFLEEFAALRDAVINGEQKTGWSR